MKYVNKLTDEEIREIYKLFQGNNTKVASLHIIRYEDSVELTGIIKFPDDEASGEFIKTEDDYTLTDFNVKVYHHTDSVTKAYREYMYKKFGEEYAKDYLFTHLSK